MMGAGHRARLLTRSLRLAPCPSSSCLVARSLRLQPPSLKPSLSSSSYKSFSIFSRIQQQQAAVAQPLESEDASSEYTQFSELADHGIVNRKVINTIVNEMNIHTMTDVQRMTINECLDGADVIAQARTGTGKTLAFLMPIVQRLLGTYPQLAERQFDRHRRADGSIKALIISPTRELAEQIAVEAKKITRNTNVKVQTAVGGTQKSMHLRMLQQQGCHILVGTPGRVKDIISDPRSGVKLDQIDTFVLDEADRLLDIGFAPDIEEIQTYMPPRQTRDRQTLMFSATVPRSVVSLVKSTLRPNFKFVRTVDPDETPTHARIPQKVVFLKGMENQVPAIVELATSAIEAHKRDPANNPPFKAIVFYGSTNEVSLAHETLQNLRAPGQPTQGRSMFGQHPLAPCQIVQMSSQLAQAARTRNSQAFRNAESAILVSSDVSARGMDFPNVSHVIQVGLPRSADDYVHRLGRTGRAGKAGQGWLLLNDDERREFRKKLYHTGIKIEDDDSLQTATLDMTQGAQLPTNIAQIMQMVESGIRAVPYEMKAQTYASLLGVLQQQNPDRRKQDIIDLINGLAKYGWGLEKPPSLSQGLVAKLGFSRCEGIELHSGFPPDGEQRGGGFGGRDRGRGRDSFDERDPFGQGARTGRGSFGNDRPRRDSYGGDRDRGDRDRRDRDRGDRGRRDSDFGGRRRGGDRFNQ